MTSNIGSARSITRLIAVSLLAAAPLAAQAATPVAAVDKGFVGKVSQGGAFEVAASQLAADKAGAADVKDFAAKDVADHEQVNDELKSIATAQGIELSPQLNAMFQTKLDALSKLSGPAFDKAYIGAMTKIHLKDEGIFAKEAKAGASPDWKAFAAKTDTIVKAHIAVLKGIHPKR